MHRSNVYRAVVQEADATTGRIAVTIPGVAGPSSRFQVTGLGRSEVEGTWKAPPIGSIVLVAAEDEDLTTLFLVQTYTYDEVVRTTDIYGDLHGPVVIEARNDTNTTISSGKVVYATADGGDLVIGLANANDAAKMPALGIAMESIAPDAVGKVAVAGLLEGINTSGLSAGIDIFAAANGGLSVTNVGLTVKQVVGKVVDVGASGSLLVTIQPVATSGGGGTSGDFTGSFTGTIYATAGVIGGSTSGWVIDSGRIESYGAGDKIILDGTDGEMYIGTYGAGAFNSPSTSFYVNKDGEFSLGDKLTWDGSTLEIDGTITAEDGFIGGWEIGPTSLHSGASSNYVALSTGGSTSIWAGASTAGSAPFRVSNTGDLYAESATIEGSITATSGSIGDWVVNGSTLQSSGASPIVLDSGNGKIYVGNANWGNTANSFYVDRTGKFGLSDNLTWNPTGGASGTGVLVLDGQIDANQATFANWSLEPYRLYAGTAGDYIELNSDPMQEYRTWAGHPTASVAPYRVRKDGQLTASSAVITGTVTAASGSIGGWAIGSSTLTGGSVTLNSAGEIVVGSGSTTAALSGTDSVYRMWAGSSSAASAPFSVQTSGYITAASANLNVYETNQIFGRMAVSSTAGSMYLGASVSPANDSGLWLNANNYWYTDGTFKTGGSSSYVRWDGSTLGIVGNITATSGSFNGAVNASAGSFSGTVYASAGSFAGDVYATGGSFSGQVNATSASIGGFSTNSSSFSAASVGLIPGSFPFYAGSNSASSAPFRVTNLGEVTAQNITITGGSINIGGAFNVSTAGDVRIGPTGGTNNALYIATNGSINIGASPGSGNFKVATNGSVNIGGSSGMYVSNDSGAMWIGNAASTAGVFSVSKEGDVRIGSQDSTALHVLATSPSTGGFLYIGPKTDGSANFRITRNGQVDIGGVGASTSLHVAPTGDMWTGSGAEASVSATFLLRNTGAVSIGGTDDDSLQITNTGNVYAGGSSFGTAQFALNASTGLVVARRGLAQYTLDPLDGFLATYNGINIVRVDGSGFRHRGGTTTEPGYSFIDDTNTGMYRIDENVLGFTTGGTKALEITSGGRLRAAVGTEALPVYSFDADSSTGMWMEGTQSLRFATAGTEVLRLTSDQRIRGLNGAVTTPTFSFINDANTGMYNSGANDTLRFATGGVEALRLNDAQRILGVDGTAASPTFAFMNEPDTGIYNGGNANSIRFATNGTEALRITTDNQVQGANGSVTDPTFSFINDPDTGMYNGGTNSNSLRFTTGGVDGLRINSSSQVLGQDGGASVPTFSFINDQDTGMYRSAANSCLIVSNGTFALGASGTGVAIANSSNTTANTATWRVGTNSLGIAELRVVSSKRESKDQIEDIDGTEALSVLSLLTPRRFVFKPFSDDDAFLKQLRPFHTQYGFVAEEVAEVSKIVGIDLHESEPFIPFVPDDPEERDAVVKEAQHDVESYVPSYWKEPHMIALCVAAIKALKAEIEELKAGR